MSKLPRNLNYAVLIVQHMPPTFTRSFADRLHKNAGVNAKEAEEGDLIEDGVVLVAPGDRHMKVKLRRIDAKLRPTITLTDEPKVHNVRPSIDLLMESAAEVFGKNIIGVILTGMGRDGASGMEAIKARHGATLAQDEDTSTVFGMPKATQDRIQVDKIVPLQEMARQITEMVCKET